MIFSFLSVNKLRVSFIGLLQTKLSKLIFKISLVSKFFTDIDFSFSLILISL